FSPAHGGKTSRSTPQPVPLESSFAAPDEPSLKRLFSAGFNSSETIILDLQSKEALARFADIPRSDSKE
ncbi:MAG: hypothetical protein SGPRY_006638, partial [Prymnesium sp.]